MALQNRASEVVDCVRAARSLDERRVAHSFARPLGEILVRGIPAPRHPSLAARVAVFVRRVLSDVGSAIPDDLPAEVVFFADSVNQYNSLEGLRATLRQAGVSTDFLVLPHVIASRDAQPDATVVKATRTEACCALLCGLLFMPRLLRRMHTVSGATPFIDKVLDVHRYLPTFLRTLRRRRPKLVVVANDHNTSCRLFAHLAREEKIPTLYLQHAQVSERFPPLDYDFVFLDGEMALQAYAAIAIRTGVPAPETRIFLNGEKKTKPACGSSGARRTIGLAVSPIDQPERLLRVISAIAADTDLPITIRPHPGTPDDLLQTLSEACARFPNVRIVSARQEPVTAFLDRLIYLVAGDSSIHLDALLRAVPTFQATLHSQPRFTDYYGFLRHGVVPPLPEAMPPAGWAGLAEDYRFPVAAIRKYSATYQTAWHGKEEILAALTVQALVGGRGETIEWLYPKSIAMETPGLGTSYVKAPE